MKLSLIVPARGGSKRLPGKNVKPLAGRPLIFHTIDACLGHKAVDHVIFTSDSQDYLNRVEAEYGDAVTRIIRPGDTAKDTAKVTSEVRRLLLDHTELFDDGWFGVCLPTAPLRDNAVVARALQQWQLSGHALFSACAYSFPVQFAFSIDSKGDWVPAFGDTSPMVTGKTRSQDIERLYRPNGAIYIQSIAQFLETDVFYAGAKPFLMDEIESADVDTELDFRIAEILAQERKKCS